MTNSKGSVQIGDVQEAGMEEADLSELTRDAFQKIAEYLNGELEGMRNIASMNGKKSLSFKLFRVTISL